MLQSRASGTHMIPGHGSHSFICFTFHLFSRTCGCVGDGLWRQRQTEPIFRFLAVHLLVQGIRMSVSKGGWRRPSDFNGVRADYTVVRQEERRCGCVWHGIQSAVDLVITVYVNG
jgi:hypothetical protein